MDENNPKKTSLGLDENVEGLLCYALGWITGIIFLLAEKENKFVKFHAVQSIIVFLTLTVLTYIAGHIPFIGWLISAIVWPVQVILWVVLMYKAYNREMFKLPIAGDIAEQQANK